MRQLIHLMNALVHTERRKCRALAQGAAVRPSPNPTLLRAPQVGYPADKPSGTLWMSQCQAVQYDYDGNQGIFKDVSQCTDQVRTAGSPAAALLCAAWRRERGCARRRRGPHQALALAHVLATTAPEAAPSPERCSPRLRSCPGQSMSSTVEPMHVRLLQSLSGVWRRRQRCANILQHNCVASEGQSGASMWDSSNVVHSILTGKVR